VETLGSRAESGSGLNKNRMEELDDAGTTPTKERKTWVSVLSHVYAWLVV